MKTTSIIKFDPDGVWLVIFKVKTPVVGEKDFYRSTVSLQSFGQNENKRLYLANVAGEKLKDDRYSVYSEYEFELYDVMMSKAPSKEFVNKWKSVKIVNCESVWDFYAKIGYNHKKKKYLNFILNFV